MQHRISGDVRLAVAQDEREGLHRRRRAAGIDDRIGDREHVLVVDRDDALEGEARAVVPGQRHRLIGGQGLAVGGPDGVEIGGLGAARADEARLGPVGVRRSGRREEPDVRALRVDGLAIVLEDDVVDLAALEIDRAADARRVDGHARGRRQGLADRPRRRSRPGRRAAKRQPGATDCQARQGRRRRAQPRFFGAELLACICD